MSASGGNGPLPEVSRADSWIWQQPGHGGSAMDTVMRHIAAKTLMEPRGANGITGWLRQVP
ncbi:hypothetical protein [Paenibacillus chitinolyticus]